MPILHEYRDLFLQYEVKRLHARDLRVRQARRLAGEAALTADGCELVAFPGRHSGATPSAGHFPLVSFRVPPGTLGRHRHFMKVPYEIAVWRVGDEERDERLTWPEPLD